MGQVQGECWNGRTCPWQIQMTQFQSLANRLEIKLRNGSGLSGKEMVYSLRDLNNAPGVSQLDPIL